MHYATAKGILSGGAMNVYRGCEHGCIYCDSRSRCYQIKHDFEDIEIKQNAPELLEAALRSKREKSVIITGSMCDPYQPVEQTERLTRKCLRIIERYGFGLSILTKSDRILEDTDLLAAISRKAKCVAQMTLTTYDEELCRVIEPNVSATSERYKALCKLRDAGIQTSVWLTPILPFINDTEQNLRGVLDYCFDAGVQGIVTFGMGLTLREGDREYFYQKLDEHFPGLKKKYVQTFGNAYECDSPNADRLMRYFADACEKNGVLWKTNEVFAYLHRMDDGPRFEQMRLF